MKHMTKKKIGQRKNRKWKVESEITNKGEYLHTIEEKASGQNVKTFIPEQWTLEYEIAANGLGEEMLKTIAGMRVRKNKDQEKEEDEKSKDSRRIYARV